MTIIKSSFVLLALAVFFAACSQTKPSNTEVKSNTPANVTPSGSPSSPVDELAEARKLYSDNCAICHKDNGTGGKVTVEGKTINPASLASESMKKKSDEKLGRQIHEGVPDEGMPAFKDKLTDAQIKDVVNFIRQGIQKT